MSWGQFAESLGISLKVMLSRHRKSQNPWEWMSKHYAMDGQKRHRHQYTKATGTSQLRRSLEAD